MNNKSGFWAKLGNEPVNNTNKSGFWAKLGNEPVNNTNTAKQQQESPSLLQRGASAAKAVIAGVGGAIPDTLSLPYNVVAAGKNARNRYNNELPQQEQEVNRMLAEIDPQKYGQYADTSQLPTIPSATEKIDNTIDKATGGYTNTPQDQRSVNEAIKFGSSFASGGGISKFGNFIGNKGISKFGNFIGNTDKTQIAGAAAAGGTVSSMQDQGASTGASLGGGIAANIGVNALPTLLSKGKNLAQKGALKGLGLSENKLNIPAYDAAKNLGIELPNSVINKSKTVNAADKFLDNVPFISRDSSKIKTKLDKQVLKELEQTYDSVINSKELVGVESRIKKAYDAADELLPQNSRITAQNTITTLDDLKSKLTSLSPSPDEKKLLTEINNIANGVKAGKTQVKDLIRTKRSLNDITNWDIQEKGVKSQFKRLSASINDDIAAYGRQNPDWFQVYEKAETLFGKVEKRKKLQNLLNDKAIDPVSGDVAYKNLSKILNDRKAKAKLEKLVEPAIIERLDELAIVTRAVAKKSKTSTASNININEKFIWGLIGAGGITNFTATSAVLGGTAAMSHLITSKKVLDLAIKFAKNPNAKNAASFSESVKQVTGYTPVSFFRAAQKLEQEKE